MNELCPLTMCDGTGIITTIDITGATNQICACKIGQHIHFRPLQHGIIGPAADRNPPAEQQSWADQ